MLMRIAAGGGVFVASAVGLFTATFLWWHRMGGAAAAVFALSSGLLLVAMLIFFRDPERTPPGSVPEGTALSPADGRVAAVEPAAQGTGPMLAVYLDLRDVHVFRAPLSATVLTVEHSAGTFHPAGGGRTATNRRVVFGMRTGAGPMQVDAVSGAVARRIVPYVTDLPARLGCGGRLGLIRFGSRVEVRFPAGYGLLVAEGDRVLAGVTPVAVPAGSDTRRP